MYYRIIIMSIAI